MNGQLDSRSSFSYPDVSTVLWGFSESGPDFIDDDPLRITITSENNIEIEGGDILNSVTGVVGIRNRIYSFDECGWSKQSVFITNSDPLMMTTLIILLKDYFLILIAQVKKIYSMMMWFGEKQILFMMESH